MSTPDIDPYGVLGVANDATIAEIRAAHRKRVLKCHPDKIQDVSQRNAAQDEFQKVQQAYELLSDDTRRKKHDERVKIAELKRKLAESRRTDSAYNSPRGGPNSREYRNGHIVEERVPMEVYFEEAMRFTEEPRSMSRKFEEMGARKPKSTPTEEKKKPRTPMSSGVRAAKEQRESTKATHSDRAKTRDQERRRQTEAKFDATYLDSDDDISDPNPPAYRYERRQSSTPRREREERESRSRPSESSRRREHRYDDEADLSDNWKAKIDDKTLHAEKYIGRSSKSPHARPYRGYDSTEPDSSGSRSERRPPRRSESRNNSYENTSTPRTYEVKPAKMPSATTSPGIKATLRPFLGARSQTTSTGYVRSKTDSRDSRKPRDSPLYDMAHEAMPPRTSKMRERTDSGYSSPNTPELPRGTSPKTSQRYSIHEAPDFRVVEPKTPHYRSTRSPERSDRDRDRERSTPTRATPKRSSTYQSYESSPHVERERPSRTSRTYGIHYITRPEEKDVKYARVYDQDDVAYSRRYEERYTPDRRQSVR